MNTKLEKIMIMYDKKSENTWNQSIYFLQRALHNKDQKDTKAQIVTQHNIKYTKNYSWHHIDS